jgi:NADPH:quinone reductase-like Zn-dependent oxidoreductase
VTHKKAHENGQFVRYGYRKALNGFAYLFYSLQSTTKVMATSAMRAWRHTSTDLPLEKGMTLVEDEPYPSGPLKPNQVLVKVKSVGVNPADPTFAELGWLARALIKPSPIPGMDFSGEVVSTGSNVTSLNPGDRVLGRVDTQKGQPGSMAEYTKAEIEGCVPIPPGIDWDHAAGVGTAAITAYESLVLNSKPGDSVFINGGTGGVGTFAIQFAKAHGCRVVVSCSTTKVNLCKELGADEVIDYRTEDLVSVLKGKGKVFNLVVDYAYREETNLYKASDDFLTDGATYVMVPGGLSGAIIKTISKHTLCPFMLGGGRAKFKAYFAKSNPEAFQQISEWMAAGKVRTVIDSVFAFEDMPRAIEQIKSGRSTGKIIVHV